MKAILRLSLLIAIASMTFIGLSASQHTAALGSYESLTMGIVYPQPLPVMPWDTVRIQLNITGAVNLQRILLIHWISTSDPTNHTSLEMTRKYESSSKVTFEASIPPYPSETEVQYIARLYWSNGDWYDYPDPKIPDHYVVRDPLPCQFNLTQVRIEKVDLDNRIIRIGTDIYLYAPTNSDYIAQDPYVVVDKSTWSETDWAAAQPSGSRFNYYLAASWKLQPFGDYRKYPF